MARYDESNTPAAPSEYVVETPRGPVKVTASPRMIREGKTPFYSRQHRRILWARDRSRVPRTLR